MVAVIRTLLKSIFLPLKGGAVIGIFTKGYFSG